MFPTIAQLQQLARDRQASAARTARKAFGRVNRIPAGSANPTR